MKEKLITKRQYNIHLYETNLKKTASIENFMNYFSDISLKQSDDLEIGFDYLTSNNLAWIIYKWDITVLRYPVYNEDITVRTWPYSLRKFYAYRQFDILDSSQNVICTANSVWLLIDMKCRKPIKVFKEMYKTYKLTEEDNTPLKIERLKPPQKVDIERQFSVRYSDIDTNMHVNNVKYIDWAVETVPCDIIKNYTLKNLKITYEKETNLGQTVNVSTGMSNENEQIVCSHEIKDEDGNKLTLVKTTWEKDK